MDERYIVEITFEIFLGVPLLSLRHYNLLVANSRDARKRLNFVYKYIRNLFIM